MIYKLFRKFPEKLKNVKFCESYHRKFPDWKKERGTGSHILSFVMLKGY